MFIIWGTVNAHYVGTIGKCKIQFKHWTSEIIHLFGKVL